MTTDDYGRSVNARYGGGDLGAANLAGLTAAGTT